MKNNHMVITWQSPDYHVILTALFSPQVIDMPEHHPGGMGGTMRLGKRKTIFKTKDCIISKPICTCCGYMCTYIHVEFMYSMYILWHLQLAANQLPMHLLEFFKKQFPLQLF